MNNNGKSSKKSTDNTNKGVTFNQEERSNNFEIVKIAKIQSKYPNGFDTIRQDCSYFIRQIHPY